MPWYWADFWEATEGQPDDVIVAYQRCIAYYWHHTHCKGLSNDSYFLMRLCRMTAERWEYVLPIIFDNDKFFTLDGSDLWHQKRAFEEWEKYKERYNKAVNAANSRWKGKKK